eukprot:XP_003730590.1 PREDICTED: putative protein TPRXL [Strongylocentrotus purpuratus]
MMGVHNGVAAFVREKNPEVYVNGCVCHLLHLAAEKGAQQLPSSPVDLLIPIFYYLEKSSKRHKAFHEVQSCCDVKQHAILKHVCTRWLSLEQALNRLIEQWVPLVEFFRSESETSSSSAQKKKSVQSKTTAKKVQPQPQPQKKNTGNAKVSVTSSKPVSGKASTSSESSSGTKRKIEDSHQNRGKRLKPSSSHQVHQPSQKKSSGYIIPHIAKTSSSKPALGKSSTTPASVSKASTSKSSPVVTKTLSSHGTAPSTSAFPSTSSIGKKASDVTKKDLPKGTKVGSGKVKMPPPRSSWAPSSQKTGQVFAGTEHAVSKTSQEVPATSKAAAIYDKLTNDENFSSTTFLCSLY